MLSLIWFLETFQTIRSAALNINHLAKSRGVTRGSFYWHFRDRDELLKSLLEYWTQELTAAVMENPKVQDHDPGQQLRKMMLMIMDHDLARYHLAIRDWAAHDANAAKAVRHVYQMRLEFVRSLFRGLGFRGQELDRRTRMFVCYHTWEQAMFDDLSKDERRKQVNLRHKLLVER